MARIIVLCVCGPLCFLCAAETLRALENDNFTLHDIPLPLGAVVLLVVLVQNSIRLRTLVWTAFADYFSDYVEIHRNHPSILSPLLYRPVSKRNWAPMITAAGLAAGMMVVTWQVASMAGQSKSDIAQVCTAMGMTLLTLPGSLMLWNSGRRMWAMIVGTGAIAVLLFWVAVTTLVAFEQLFFDNANPGELTMVSVGVFCGGLLLAWLAFLFRMRTILRHHLHTDPHSDKHA